MNKRRCFTLLEVVLAMAVLALGLLAGLSLQGSAMRRTQRAMADWEQQHLLAQAAEFYLLAGPKAEIPATLFDAPGWQAQCRAAPATNLPPGVAAQAGGWQLTELTISLSENGVPVRSLRLEKWIPQDELP